MDQITRCHGQADFTEPFVAASLKDARRRHGLAVDILDAMIGHSRKTAADTYEEFPPEAMLRELSKLPELRFDK
jgi:predicted transcriptional regulator